MAKRKKHQKLPNGWGSIRYLGKGRRRPYAVHPPATERDEDGNYLRPPALCYVGSWYAGFAVLNAYRAGTYKPGDEAAIQAALDEKGKDPGGLDAFVDRVIADSLAARGAAAAEEKGPTLAEVYDAWYEWKCGENAAKPPSKATMETYRSNRRRLAALEGMEFSAITVDDLQGLFNGLGLAKGTLQGLKVLLGMVYEYAEQRGIVEKNLAPYVVIPGKAADIEHGVPFTESDIKALWEDREDPASELAVILCYSGHRRSEMKGIEVDLERGAFIGGIKTAAGLGRVVPIHPAVRGLVERRLREYGRVMPQAVNTANMQLQKRLALLGLERHTLHDCRHTFSTLCERYGVPEADRKRMMGHSFGNDVTNGTYGHRTLEDLAASIARIPAPDAL